MTPTITNRTSPHTLSGTPPRLYQNQLSLRNQIGRALWGIVWLTLFYPTPVFCFGWRRMLLRLFGGEIASTALVYPSTRIWAPWNLTMEANACLGREVDCYSVASIRIGCNATVSQRTFLCTASHDIRVPGNPLMTGPIVIEQGAFVFAEAFVGMDVTIGQEAVVAARAVVVKDVMASTIVAGNPARVIGERFIANADSRTEGDKGDLLT
jgi:putative colanic acid biosynthesis acetyltransferase WcaF